MNRIELERKIKDEGKRRGMKITECRIYNRGDKLSFYPTIDNATKEGWIFKSQIKELIDDLAPIERPHEIGGIDLDYHSRHFEIGEKVELDGIWIRLDAGEEEQKDLIDAVTYCGQYRQGWVTGIIVEMPEQNDRVLVIKFDRDIYIEEKCEWWSDVTVLEQAIKEGKIKKIEKGQPVYCGTLVWEVRKREKIEEIKRENE